MLKLNYQKYLGVKFKYHGRSIEEGFDCWGLQMAIAKELNQELAEYAYSETPEKTFISRLLKDGIQEHGVKLEKPEPFCFVVFDIGGLWHIGRVLDDCINFIHIMSKRSVAIERLDKQPWKNLIRGFYKYVESDKD